MRERERETILQLAKQIFSSSSYSGLSSVFLPLSSFFGFIWAPQGRKECGEKERSDLVCVRAIQEREKETSLRHFFPEVPPLTTGEKMYPTVIPLKEG